MLYEFRRRESDIPPKRWALWWSHANEQAKAKEMHLAPVLRHLAAPGLSVWICSDESADKALAFFKELPGWVGLDGEGHPITCVRLSPLEERIALKDASPEMRASLVPECGCNVNAPRSVRREAERLWQKYVANRIKQLEQQP